MVLEGGKRILSKAINKKEPITAEIVLQLYNHFKDNFDLFNCRSMCMFLLAYAGFFRFKELTQIKMKNINLYDTHVEILVESSKTDVYREGNKVVIAKTNTVTCPVKFLLRYCSLAELPFHSEEYLFRSIQFNKHSNKNNLS